MKFKILQIIYEAAEFAACEIQSEYNSAPRRVKFIAIARLEILNFTRLCDGGISNFNRSCKSQPAQNEILNLPIGA